MDGVARNRYDTTMSSGRGHSTDTTRVPGQKVRISISDRWMPLNFFSRVFEGCFGWSSMESVHHADVVRSGHSTDKTRVPGQKVRILRSDSWIALRFFSRVFEGCFRWSSVESVRHADTVRSGPIHRQDHSTGSKGPYL